jgi:uncharacterized surface anchored protein
VAQATSNIQGQIIFTDLTPGSYILRETSTLPGYQRNTGSWPIVVSQSGAVAINGLLPGDLSIDNAPSYTFVFIKQDAATRNNLPGVVYTLSQDGNVVATATSNFSGQVIFLNLSPGIYTLKEIAAPPGYMISGETYIVTVTQEGDVLIDSIPRGGFTYIRILYNTPYVTLNIHKRSAVTEAPLQGAEFTIMQDGETIAVLTTDSSGIASYEFTVTGEFTLVESRPPAGYAPNTTQYNVWVSDYGYIDIWTDNEYYDATNEDFVIFNTPL